MSIVTINLNNKKFQLFCSDEGKEELLNLTGKLNQRIIDLKNVNPTASFELLLIMSGLSLEEEVQNLNTKVEQFKNNPPQNDPEEFSETLTTIAGYLENLARKIGK